ncbi:MAG: hypothetical protein ACRERX_13895, partial [Pseudomonas sp.]
MQTFLRCVAVVGTACVLASCASSARLARQSRESLARGDLRAAYERGLRAVEKDPQNQPARDAYAAASARVAADYRQRVVAAAAADTIVAANLALEYGRFRTEVARHGTGLEAAPDYARAEGLILTGTARVHYQRGLDAMSAHRPKVAVQEFSAVLRYDAGFADVAARLDAARRDATVRVALLPFSDRIGVPGLTQEIGDTVQRQVSRRADREFRFTQVVSASEIERSMTVAELRSARIEDALDVGRRIGADWIVVGRFRGLRTNAGQRTTKFALYQRVDRRDSSGVATVRWDELPLSVITRQREVTVQFDLDVVDVVSGAVLAHREQAARAFARVAWT